MAAPVELAQAAKYYGQVLGLAEVSLTVDGGIVGLLGPNGAGKSTLMKLVAGLHAPSRGSVWVFGAPPWTSRDARRHIGYCPEHESTYDELTAFELVTLLAELAGVPRRQAKERAEAVLTDVGLTEAMHRRLGGFSKGMRQRAKLAQALAHDPELLLLDEPLTGCDPLARAHLVDMIRALGQAGKTILLSSHVLHEIEALTQQIVLIHRGQVLAEGNVYRLRELIDERPHRVRIECDRPRALAQGLIALDHVARVQIDGTALELETVAPDLLYDAIPGLARSAATQIAALTSPDNNIQAVFEYLTEKKRA